MKKLLVCLLAFLMLAGCAAREPEPTESAETTVSVETEIPETEGLQNSEIFSQEMAMLEGYVVMQDGDVRHNAGSWFAFLKGETGTVTVMQYTRTEAGSSCIRYDLSFDGTDYILTFRRDGETVTEKSQVLVIDSGRCAETEAPYDTYEAYFLNDILIYKDLIAQPDFEGVKEIFLHEKEGEPPVKSFRSVEETDPILQLLMTAEYLPAEPETYGYGMKLLMTNRDGKELVIELDINQGIYRYGMQTYKYGTVSDMLAALGLDGWPETVMNEFEATIG